MSSSLDGCIEELKKKDEEIARLRREFDRHQAGSVNQAGIIHKQKVEIARLESERKALSKEDNRVINELMREKYLICATLWDNAPRLKNGEHIIPLIVDEILKFKRERKEVRAIVKRIFPRPESEDEVALVRLLEEGE